MAHPTATDRRTPVTSGDFRPPPWLRHPHVQSIYPSLPLRRRAVERRCDALLRASRDVLVDGGDGVRLLAHVATQGDVGRSAAHSLAVLIHGWEGSANSLYVLALGQSLLEAGYDVARLNLRDHGESHHLNAELFHSCRIDEVVGAVRTLQRTHGASRRLCLAGFSLGGNFALRVGARAAEAGIDVSRIVAVCPVVDPEHTLVRLEHGWALYRQYFIWKWRRSLRRKQRAWPEVYASLGDILRLDNLTDMTGRLAVHYGGFPSLQEYLHGYSLVGPALERLTASPGLRARIISAADDPIIPASDLERIARPPNLEVTLTSFGGHCGFYGGRSGSSWLERVVMESFGGRDQRLAVSG
jgi:predicted alpha/beta-fold hydrolase